MKNYYQILEINENASPEIIEKSYRTLAKKYHPDMWPANQSYWAEDRFKEITEAYQVLSNSSLKAEYDMKIGIPNTIESKYNNLYNEHEMLKQEVNSMKIKNKSNEYIKNNNLDNNQSYFKRYSSNLSSLIKNEIQVPPEERKKNLKALILTIIIISILVFIFWKVSFLHNFLFP